MDVVRLHPSGKHQTLSRTFSKLRRMHLQLSHELMSERHQQAGERQFHIQF